MKCRAFFVIFFCFATLTLAFGEPETPLGKAEALLTELKFYDALVALEPLLTTDQKSEAQEQALWLANTLCKTLVHSADFYKRYREEYKGPKKDGKFIFSDKIMKWDAIIVLNKWGANIEYEYLGSSVVYQHGFLKRLVTLYPNSSWCPAAEYYLIEWRYNEVKAIEESLNARYAYVNKYAKSGLAEVYTAYLDIARINDGLWEALSYPDGAYRDYGLFTDNTPERDKERAAKHKAEALKYYAKFIVSGYGGGYSQQLHRDIIERFKDLKQDKESRHVWIIND